LPHAAQILIYGETRDVTFLHALLMRKKLATGVSKYDQFPLTRDAALSRLQAFLPLAGPAYTRMRNLDREANSHVHGAGARTKFQQFPPMWLRSKTA
jgi:hypothetical protein